MYQIPLKEEFRTYGCHKVDSWTEEDSARQRYVSECIPKISGHWKSERILRSFLAKGLMMDQDSRYLNIARLKYHTGTTQNTANQDTTAL